ncbi:immobilization antigen isoform, putative [Ichthyophthirius multifiliis]|uniref:Immobilization antigen isoform, putative n=1 Tax=Ichthyophthirius multifiliis TaxID=5932 RepID=G0QPL2_ICHMU|nr:immobilization antigen isoform, putative [Ichthyophthirius multifiliis]EGR32844.1 immobilization antigen isoform, putative [Ichthyophthirius multifiliis]|eukprot:XP_004036830.1 immobilization antigen isoform, putative [Ichthyophthirius multifiliis]
MYKNILITLIFSLFLTELKATLCPNGTETNVANQRDDGGNPTNCVNCRVNFYFNGVPATFNPGVSQCMPCIDIKTEDAQANSGRIATLTLQCKSDCPDGTQTALGNTNYLAQRQECSFCQANHYFYSEINVFRAGGDGCDACPVRKTSGAEAIAGINASLAQQCDVTCPDGTVTATGSTSFVQDRIECVNCAKHNKADLAKIDLQCEIKCPAGTVLLNGITTNFSNNVSECVKCAANFYTTKQNGWVAGTDICVPCSNILTSGAEANFPATANQEKQCRITGAAKVFSQFIQFSLIFIYLYFL